MPTSPPAISALPTPPSTSSPTNFDSQADAFLGALPDLASDIGAVASNVYANAVEAASSASTASTAATTASTAATTALNAPATQATSSTSLTIGGGSKSLTLAQTGKAFAIGQWVSVADTTNPSTRWLAGAVSAFDSGTGAMTIDVAYITGSGSGGSWAVTPIAPIIAMDASKLSTGTIPDARFPATLPSGVAVPAARLTGTVSIPVASTSSAAIGYGIGAGSTVTQATDKFTTVTLNKPSGRITMNAAALASGASVNFILNNNALVLPYTVSVNIVGGVSDVRKYDVSAGFNSNGSVQIILRNISGGALSEAAQIQFNVLQGATT